jgi:hypothetical protein
VCQAGRVCDATWSGPCSFCATPLAPATDAEPARFSVESPMAERRLKVVFLSQDSESSNKVRFLKRRFINRTPASAPAPPSN